MTILDNGIGMDEEDFDEKFLKIGYSKRATGETHSRIGRPFIGRKGIGKLALLSCAKSVSIITKRKESNIVGSVIDNDKLDEAIKNDESNIEFELEDIEENDIKLFGDREEGTLIRFKGLKPSITKSEENIRKAIAMYFRFALIDKNFKITLDDEEIGLKDLGDLPEKTEFLWEINESGDDDYIQTLSKTVIINKKVKSKIKMHGFIASVKKPKDLKVFNTDEKLGIDLFVNGRLREKNLLQYFQSARIAESYMYGQIHFDELDGKDGVDRFTSSREGILADDEKFQLLISELKDILSKILEEWDKFRLDNKEDGDDENPRVTRRDRASRKLYNVIAEDYAVNSSVKKWIDELADDANYNYGSYAECYITENLLRKYISTKKLELNTDNKNEVQKWKNREEKYKQVANLQISIRLNNDDLFYLDFEHLAKTADPNTDGLPDKLINDGHVFTPIRNAVMHTSRITDEAKSRLTTVFQNVKAKIVKLLKEDS